MPQNDSMSAAGFLAGKSFCFFSSIGNNYWVIDSGASDHITHDLSLLHDIRPIQQPCYITMPNGKKAQILCVGSMSLGAGIVLKDVLYTPEFQFNLLSINKVTKQLSANVVFTPDCCLLQDQIMKRAVILGKENQALYCMRKEGQSLKSKLSQPQPFQTTTQSVTVCFLSLIHI